MSKSEPDEPTIMIYGMRRTGTNITSKVLASNYVCSVPRGPRRRRRTSWKHGARVHDDALPNAITIAMVRDPLSWLPSFFRLEKKQKRVCPEMTFIEWSKGHWMQSRTKRRRWSWSTSDPEPQRHEGCRVYCPAAFDWSRTYGYWSWRSDRIIHYEDIVLDPGRTLDEVAEAFGVQRLDDTFRHPEDYVGPVPRDGGRQGCVERLKHKTYLRHWSEEGLNALRRTVDPVVLEKMGYSLDVQLPKEHGIPVETNIL